MQSGSSYSITCQHCQKEYTLSGIEKPKFCPFCGSPFSPNFQIDSPTPGSQMIGYRYQVVENIGKGGMGEVLLVYDLSLTRQIALKRIRPDLLHHTQVRNRFLKEARITCQLTHPAIIPIYTIHTNEEATYYTMPYVEGETLKQIIRKTRLQEKKGEKLDHIGGSIPALMRIFITICQAIAYAHSKGVIHRDLKLENIIVGKYGEVLILDWGLAKLIHTAEEEGIETLKVKDTAVTHIGKVVGTIAYMAPEQAKGHPATIQTDIYSLGAILYQMLTLRPPFKRGKVIEDFKKSVDQETFIDPVIVAPYRDVPRVLSEIAEKCLSPNLSDRYKTVDELIQDLENYLEGRSAWFYVSSLDIKNKEDWEFQENVLLAEHMALTRVTEEVEWVSLMVSQLSFFGNTKIETEITINEFGHGIGFLFSVPEATERTYINDGYCLWLGSDLNKTTRLLRSNVEVLHASDIFLKRNQKYKIRLEKIEQSIHLFIDDTLQLSYVAHTPLIGTHVGLLARDDNFDLAPLDVYVGSLNIMVNCLAVPDAFLAHRDFNQALSEYRRIAYSFPDRAEGREAIFRAGLTLIEQAKSHTSPEKEELLDQALEEFEQLHNTPGAPLEYLGKALVYQTLNEEEEEIKCFELAYRRYLNHPLLAMLQEQVISRMHELSRYHRIAAYHFVLLAARHFPLGTIDTHTKRLFNSLQKHWEQLPFVEEEQSKDKSLHHLHFATQLAFWLAKPYVLGEILEELENYESGNTIAIGNALFCLIELGSSSYAKEILNKIKSNTELSIELPYLLPLEILLESGHKSLEQSIKQMLNTTKEFNVSNWRAINYLLNLCIDREETNLIHQTIKTLRNQNLTSEQRLILDIHSIWAYLLEKKWSSAEAVFNSYPAEWLNKESTPLYFLYGCLLQATEGKEKAYSLFTDLLNVPYPRSWTLGSHYLAGDLPPEGPWYKKAFIWEKRQLYRQLALYYSCSNDRRKCKEYKERYQQHFIYVET